MTNSSRVAVVTGANRGIGLEISKELARKGLQVILTSRDPKKGEAAAQKLAQEGLKVQSHPLDVQDPQSIENFARYITKEIGRVDVLVNNAGIFEDEAGK